jgi:hypothetical protein
MTRGRVALTKGDLEEIAVRQREIYVEVRDRRLAVIAVAKQATAERVERNRDLRRCSVCDYVSARHRGAELHLAMKHRGKGHLLPVVRAHEPPPPVVFVEEAEVADAYGDLDLPDTGMEVADE